MIDVVAEVERKERQHLFPIDTSREPIDRFRVVRHTLPVRPACILHEGILVDWRVGVRRQWKQPAEMKAHLLASARGHRAVRESRHAAHQIGRDEIVPLMRRVIQLERQRARNAIDRRCRRCSRRCDRRWHRGARRQPSERPCHARQSNRLGEIGYLPRGIAPRFGAREGLAETARIRVEHRDGLLHELVAGESQQCGSRLIVGAERGGRHDSEPPPQRLRGRPEHGVRGHGAHQMFPAPGV